MCVLDPFLQIWSHMSCFENTTRASIQCVFCSCLHISLNSTQKVKILIWLEQSRKRSVVVRQTLILILNYVTFSLYCYDDGYKVKKLSLWIQYNNTYTSKHIAYSICITAVISCRLSPHGSIT